MENKPEDNRDCSEIVSFVKKFADLIIVEFKHNDLPHWDVFSNKFRFSPDDKVEDGFYPIRAIINNNGHIKLKILSFVASEANWFTQRGEAEVIIRSLSYYGHRHKFCPGIIASEFGCLEGYLSPETIAKNTIYSQNPYVHYRSKECAYFYSTQKSSITKIVTSSRCTNCRKTLASKKALKMAQLRHPDLPPKKVSLSKVIKKDEMLGASDILILPNSFTLASEKNAQTTKKKKDEIQPSAAFNEIVVEMDPQIVDNRTRLKRRKEDLIQPHQVLEDFDIVYLPE